MRRLCILLFISVFNSAFGQSKISGTVKSHPADNAYSQAEQPFSPENGYPGNLPESAYNHLKPRFQPGIIITKNGDTLAGLVKYNYPVPYDKVIYRPNLLSSDSIFSIQMIKSVITQFVYLANNPFEGKEKMMPWLAVGKINLYADIKIYDNSFLISHDQPYNQELLKILSSGSADITYVLEKNNQFTYINKKDFKVMMRHVLYDVPDMLKKIGRKGYKFDDMPGIVKEYNKRFR